MENHSLELSQWIAKNILRKGGQRVTILDLRGHSDITDFIVIASGTSKKHMETLVESPLKDLKTLGQAPLKVEGIGTHWVVADLGSVMLHVFDDAARQYFDLEGLWIKAPQLEVEENTNAKVVS